MASGTIAIAAALVLAITAAATAMGQGMTAAKAMEAIARQPEAAGSIRGALVISLALESERGDRRTLRNEFNGDAGGKHTDSMSRRSGDSYRRRPEDA